MSIQQISSQAEATREQARSPDGKFGVQPASEADGDVLTGTVEDDLASVTDPDRAQDRNGEVARLVAARETLRQCLRRSFPGATKVRLRQDEGYPGPHLAEATGPDGEFIDLTEPENFPADGAYYSYDAAVEHGASSWDATVVDEIYGPEVDGARTLELEVDHPDAPWGEDWHDPDTGQPDHFDSFSEAASHGPHRSVAQERDRLVRGREAFKELFRAYQPSVTRVEICEESDGPYIESATDAAGARVELEYGWPEDVDTGEVNEGLRQLMASPNDGDRAQVWGYERGSYWVEI
ncbi:hypothetical protein [Ornithinimicrobium murale]|uniref:hypothetical protein n=1 Tax=Ornithinimicrobium murale TaxID=1050153 RepID=UPI000E0CBFF4|nr:hypothetical protein [Ornithinimicrobium murale]